MTRIITTLALATTIVAAQGGTALAQDTVSELRTHCETLELVQSPAVVDCFQELADAESADGTDAAQAVVDAYANTQSPHDFEQVLTASAADEVTLFDG